MTLEDRGWISLKGSVCFKPSAYRIIAQVPKSLPPHLSNVWQFLYLSKTNNPTSTATSYSSCVCVQMCDWRQGFNFSLKLSFFYSAQNYFCWRETECCHPQWYKGSENGRLYALPLSMAIWKQYKNLCLQTRSDNTHMNYLFSSTTQP